jgi:hypothetical protein
MFCVASFPAAYCLASVSFRSPRYGLPVVQNNELYGAKPATRVDASGNYQYARARANDVEVSLVNPVLCFRMCISRHSVRSQLTRTTNFVAGSKYEALDGRAATLLTNDNAERSQKMAWQDDGLFILFD